MVETDMVKRYFRFICTKCFWSFVILIFSAVTKLSAQTDEHTLLGNEFFLRIQNDSVRAVHKANGYEFNLRLVSYTDLNSDGLKDLITVDTSSCGNWGDCIYTFFLQQADDFYVCLFSDYLYQFKELQTRKTSAKIGWLQYNVYERTDNTVRMDRDDYPLKRVGILKYDGKQYVLKKL